MRDLFILLIIFKWQVLATEYMLKEDIKKADVKVSLNDNFTIAAFNSKKFYVLHFVSNDLMRGTYRINYLKHDLHVYSLSALTIKSDKTVSFIQVVRTSMEDSVLLRRIDMNLASFGSGKKELFYVPISKTLNSTGQRNILLKVDPEEKYAYIFTESYVLSYNLLTNNIDQKTEVNVVECDGYDGEFIPCSLDLNMRWAALAGFHRIQNSSRTMACLYFFTLQPLKFIEARVISYHRDANFENTDYSHGSPMSVSINPSGTKIAVGIPQINAVTLVFSDENRMPRNTTKLLQIAEHESSMNFGRSVAWLNDQGTLAILVGKSGNRTRPQSEIQVYTNISSNRTSGSILPYFTLPNNQQVLQKIEHNECEHYRSLVLMLAGSRNLLLLRDDDKFVHIPLADPGFCSRKPVALSITTYNLTQDLCASVTKICTGDNLKALEKPKIDADVYVLEQKPCVSGTYSNVTGFGPCIICPSGTKNPGDNISTKCELCQSTQLCPLGASSEVDLTQFNSTTQVFNYPDSPIIDNYDDLLLLNFIPNKWTPRCIMSSPLFIGVLFMVLSFIIWLIMLQIKKKQPSPYDIHRKRAKIIFKHNDFVGEGERLVGGLASIVIFAIVVYTVIFAIYYFFSYSSDDTWIHNVCNGNQRNTKFDNALQLPLPEPTGNDWKIFSMLSSQTFHMNVDLINTGASFDNITVQHNKITGTHETINKTNGNTFNNSFITSLSFEIPTHSSTVQVFIDGPYFIGALRLCLHGLPLNEPDEDGYHELQKLDVCTLFHVENQTIGLSTYFHVDLIKVINVTKPLQRNQKTNYSGIWKTDYKIY